MYIFDSVIIVCFSICVYCDDLGNWRADSEGDIDGFTLPEDYYSFVALIDIVYTNGAKRICTGTIIHDNVVITAAHCFSTKENCQIQTDISASFVVIGTKKMFDTGYEQYLPIERIIIHPKYKGWTADLALVHTFSGMMSDKPGQVVPLATDNSISPIESDVIVFSWGKCIDINGKLSFGMTTIIFGEDKLHDFEVTGTQEKDTTIVLKDEPGKLYKYIKEIHENNKTNRQRRKKHLRLAVREDGKQYRIEHAPVTKTVLIIKQPDRPMSLSEEKHSNEFKNEKSKEYYEINKSNRQRQQRKKRIRFEGITNRNKYRIEHAAVTKARVYSRPMSSIEENNRYEYNQQRYANYTDFDSEEEQNHWKSQLEMLNQLYERSEVNKERMAQRDRRQSEARLSFYRNDMRRKMGGQVNNLTIEIFGFVHMHACRKLLHKAVPSLYRIKKRQEFLCYSSERRFITEDDAGAPAIRRDRLVAVTVGGVEHDGERVAVGLKMVCFCSWIAKNIPSTGTELVCCKNCCNDSDNIEERVTKKPPHRHSHKKRRL